MAEDYAERNGSMGKVRHADAIAKHHRNFRSWVSTAWMNIARWLTYRWRAGLPRLLLA
jgi:hypothetical protein